VNAVLPKYCPLCDAETDPADLHVIPGSAEAGELEWSYECLNCDSEYNLSALDLSAMVEKEKKKSCPN